MKRIHKRAEELNNYQLGVSDDLPAWNDLHEDMVDDHNFKLRQERQYRRMLKQLEAENAAAGASSTSGGIARKSPPPLRNPGAIPGPPELGIAPLGSSSALPRKSQEEPGSLVSNYLGFG